MSATGAEIPTPEVPRGAAAVFGPTIDAVLAPARAFATLDARPMLAVWPLLWTVAGMVLLGVWNLGVTRQIMRVAMVQGMMRQGQQPDPEQLGRTLETMDRFAPAWAIGGNLFIVLAVLAIAVLIWMGASLLGGRTNFARSLGVASVAAVVHPLIATSFVSVMWKLDPPQISRMEDLFDSLPSLGLDLLVRGGETSTFVRTLLARVDLFNVWWMVLITIGGQRLLGLRKGAAAGLAVVLWALSAVLSAFWAGFGS